MIELILEVTFLFLLLLGGFFSMLYFIKRIEEAYSLDNPKKVENIYNVEEYQEDNHSQTNHKQKTEDIIVCPNCGKENRKSFNYCEKCVTEL